MLSEGTFSLDIDVFDVVIARHLNMAACRLGMTVFVLTYRIFVRHNPNICAS
jgi:hypothetical protein